MSGGAWGAIAAEAADTAKDLYGARKNESMFKRSQWFNAAEAQKQRDWEERMSSTAVQRASADFEAAGLNRILAIGSPSSTPSGASASSSPSSINTRKMDIMRKIQMQQEIASARAAENLTKEQTRLTSAEADKQEVLKKGYDIALPYIEKFADSISNARDADSVYGDVKAGSAKAVENWKRGVEEIHNSIKGLSTRGKKYLLELHKKRSNNNVDVLLPGYDY